MRVRVLRLRFIWRGCMWPRECTTPCSRLVWRNSFIPTRSKTFNAIGSAIDLELADEFARQMSGEQAAGAGESRSVFMDYYANLARAHMARYGTTREQFARIAAKNHTNGSLNPHAQFQTPRTVEDILAAPLIAEPLTRMMCSPIGDGAAAVVVTTAEKARQLTAKPVFVRASIGFKPRTCG